MVNVLLKNYSEIQFLGDYDLLSGDKRILNAGSSSVRYGENCVNVDIQDKPNVDIVGDIHDLPESIGSFDVVVCNAVMQYCHTPKLVAESFFRVLKPGGFLFIDAPWIQPLCPDTPDRFRFSEDGLKSLFSRFEIIEIGPSIRPGSAFAMLGIHIARTLTRNRYTNAICALVATLLLFPLRWVKTAREEQSAGAFYLIARKSQR